MRATFCLIALLPLMAPDGAAAAATGAIRAQTVTNCMNHMRRELPDEPANSLRPGCTCQLTHIRDHVSSQDYAFWEAQLAIMGDDEAPQMQRTQNLMRLFQSPGAGASMSRVADAAEAALDACHLDTWKTTP